MSEECAMDISEHSTAESFITILHKVLSVYSNRTVEKNLQDKVCINYRAVKVITKVAFLILSLYWFCAGGCSIDSLRRMLEEKFTVSQGSP